MSEKKQVEMAASIKHEFKKSFLIDEEKLRKISDLIRNRIEKQGTELPLIYKIHRTDAFTYTTPNLNDVTKEENLPWQRIDSLSVEAEVEATFELKILFDKDGTNLNITGSDRDFVFLIFSDLREYIANEVNILNHGRMKTILGGLVAILIFAFMLGFIFTLFNINDNRHPDVEAVLKSQDITEKLNYLIDYRKSQARTPLFFRGVPWIMILLLVFFSLYTAIQRLSEA